MNVSRRRALALGRTHDLPRRFSYAVHEHPDVAAIAFPHPRQSHSRFELDPPGFYPWEYQDAILGVPRRRHDSSIRFLSR